MAHSLVSQSLRACCPASWQKGGGSGWANGADRLLERLREVHGAARFSGSKPGCGRQVVFRCFSCNQRREQLGALFLDRLGDFLKVAGEDHLLEQNG